MRHLITIIFITLYAVVLGQQLNKKDKQYIVSRLNSILEADQTNRMFLTLGTVNSTKVDSIKKLPFSQFVKIQAEVMKQNGILNKKTIDSLWTMQMYSDSINTENIISIIKKYGYPSSVKTGSMAMSTITLHLIDKVNYEKLYPFYQSELLKGNMPPHEFAAAYDRHQLLLGKHQLYGEYDTFNPCVDNIDVTNIERQKIGLQSLSNNNCR